MKRTIGIVTENTIKLSTKEISRYEIFIEAVNHNESLRFPVKTKKHVEKEFLAAVSMCRQENWKSKPFRIYRCVKAIDRANCDILLQTDF